MHAMDSLAAAAPLAAPRLPYRGPAAQPTAAISLHHLPRLIFSGGCRRRRLLVASGLPLPLETVSADSLQYESGFLGAISERTRTVAVEDLPQGAPMTTMNDLSSSRVYDVAIVSPLDLASQLSERLGVDVWLKREDLQPVFSFKPRGAYNMMAQLSREQLDRGVICSSAGNHAQAVALCAKKLGCDALIVMPVTTEDIKLRSVKRLGATVVLKGESFDEAQSYAKWLSEQEGRTFIPAFDHPDIVIGQATIGMEISRQLEGPLHAIFVPVGGGGLLAGIAAYMKRVRPEVKIIGVEPYDSNAMALSLYHGKRIMLQEAGRFADGVAIKVVGEEPFRVCKELVDGVVLVSHDAICASIRDMFEETRSILEPAGALSLAGAEAYCKYYGLKHTSVVAITSGANMNFERLRRVAELVDVGLKREAVFATTLPDQRGSFKTFCELVGDMNVTEFKYRSVPQTGNVPVFYSVALHTDAELEAMVDRMKSARLQTTNITNDDLLKDHFRYFMGAGLSCVNDEVFCRFTFPKRPGALMKFLDAFSPRWNISLFHYRAQGEAAANALVGFIVPALLLQEFMKQVDDLGYKYSYATTNESQWLSKQWEIQLKLPTISYL